MCHYAISKQTKDNCDNQQNKVLLLEKPDSTQGSVLLCLYSVNLVVFIAEIVLY